jgi:hypothetical protein
MASCHPLIDAEEIGNYAVIVLAWKPKKFLEIDHVENIVLQK